MPGELDFNARAAELGWGSSSAAEATASRARPVSGRQIKVISKTPQAKGSEVVRVAAVVTAAMAHPQAVPARVVSAPASAAPKPAAAQAAPVGRPAAAVPMPAPAASAPLPSPAPAPAALRPAAIENADQSQLINTLKGKIEYHMVDDRPDLLRMNRPQLASQMKKEELEIKDLLAQLPSSAANSIIDELVNKHPSVIDLLNYLRPKPPAAAQAAPAGRPAAAVPMPAPAASAPLPSPAPAPALSAAAMPARNESINRMNRLLDDIKSPPLDNQGLGTRNFIMDLVDLTHLFETSYLDIKDSERFPEAKDIFLKVLESTAERIESFDRIRSRTTKYDSPEVAAHRTEIREEMQAYYDQARAIARQHNLYSQAVPAPASAAVRAAPTPVPPAPTPAPLRQEAIEKAASEFRYRTQMHSSFGPKDDKIMSQIIAGLSVDELREVFNKAKMPGESIADFVRGTGLRIESIILRKFALAQQSIEPAAPSPAPAAARAAAAGPAQAVSSSAVLTPAQIALSRLGLSAEEAVKFQERVHEAPTTQDAERILYARDDQNQPRFQTGQWILRYSPSKDSYWKCVKTEGKIAQLQIANSAEIDRYLRTDWDKGIVK